MTVTLYHDTFILLRNYALATSTKMQQPYHKSRALSSTTSGNPKCFFLAWCHIKCNDEIYTDLSSVMLRLMRLRLLRQVMMTTVAPVLPVRCRWWWLLTCKRRRCCSSAVT